MKRILSLLLVLLIGAQAMAQPRPDPVINYNFARYLRINGGVLEQDSLRNGSWRTYATQGYVAYYFNALANQLDTFLAARPFYMDVVTISGRSFSRLNLHHATYVDSGYAFPADIVRWDSGYYSHVVSGFMSGTTMYLRTQSGGYIPITGVTGGGGGGPTLTFTANQNYNAYGNFVPNTLDSTKGGTLLNNSNGFYGLPKLTNSPGSIANTIQIFQDSAGNRAYRYPTGFIREFIGNITANRTATWFDASDTIANRQWIKSFNQMSITNDPGLGFRLSGDAASPGANKVYSTDGSGVKGWNAAAAPSSPTVKLSGTTVGTQPNLNFVPDADRSTYTLANNGGTSAVDITVRPKWNFEVWFMARASSIQLLSTGLSNSTGNTANQDYVGGTLWDATTSVTGRMAAGISQNSVLMGNALRTYRVETVWDAPLGTSTNDFHIYTGFINAYESGGAQPTDGCYFHQYYASNSANFICECGNNSTYTTTNTSTTFTGGTTYVTVVEVLNGIAKFYINGTLVATISTNVPTTRSTGAGISIWKIGGAGNTGDPIGSIRHFALSWNKE